MAEQTYKLEKFVGPLDLLLQMIQQEELDISEVSLAAVAEQFVFFVKSNPDQISGEELADFLLVATQLLLLKSKTLLPQVDYDDDLQPDTLQTQLKLYRRFVDAARRLEVKIAAKQFLHTRIRSVYEVQARFAPPAGVSGVLMLQEMKNVIKKLEPIIILPESVMKKTITLQEKIGQIAQMIKHKSGLSFKTILSGASSKMETIISFLALLELLKQDEVTVKQSGHFQDIIISKSQRSQS